MKNKKLPVVMAGPTLTWYYAPTLNSRRVKWFDVKRSLWNVLIITKDFLLIKSRFFYESSILTTGNSTSGCMGRLVPSLSDSPIKTGAALKSEAYTNMTYSVGSKPKKRVRRSSLTRKKKSKCACTRKEWFKGRHTKNRCWLPRRK